MGRQVMGGCMDGTNLARVEARGPVMKSGLTYRTDWREGVTPERGRLFPLAVANLISLRIVSPSSGTVSGDSPELRSALERLDGILTARYDEEAGRIRIQFDPERMTILKILNATENLGQQLGHPVRPADVQAMGWQPWGGPSRLSPQEWPDVPRA